MAKPKPKQKLTIVPGCLVRTNAAFERLFGGETRSWRGEVLSEVANMPGTWRVRVDGVGPIQWIHAKFLEAES